MKRIFLIVMLLIILFLNGKSNEIKNKKKKYRLKTRYSILTVDRNCFFNLKKIKKKAMPWNIVDFIYDFKGRLIKKDSRKGGDSFDFIFEYPEKNVMEVYDGDGFDYKYIFYYNDDKNLIKLEVFEQPYYKGILFPMREIQDVNERNRYYKEREIYFKENYTKIEYKLKEIYEYEYNERGYLSKYKSSKPWDSHGLKVLLRPSNPKVLLKPFSHLEYSVNNDTITIYDYEYDEKGRVTKIFDFDRYGNKDSTAF